jgi:hypothetical protein
MARSTVTLMALLFAFRAMSAPAGQFNSVLNIGDPAPNWKDLPGVDGKNHSLAGLQDRDVLVVVFTCNSCPIAGDYEDRIIAFAKAKTPGQLTGRVTFALTLPSPRGRGLKKPSPSGRGWPKAG